MTSAVVFCDFLALTYPRDLLGLVARELGSVLAEAGAVEEMSGLWRTGAVGTVRLAERYRVGTVGFSGGALGLLRDKGLYADTLRALGTYEHRVTRLDATMDVACDAPEVLAGLHQRAMGGELALSRKAIPATAVQVYMTAGLADGRQTGTVYLGSQQAKVRAVVYDKREEQMRNWGRDPGPLLRYEVRVKGELGPTLRDAWEPAAMFYHFMAPDVLPRPQGVSAWRGYGGGYVLPAATPQAPYVRLKRAIDESPMVGQWVRLAEEAGGEESFIRVIREAYRRAVKSAQVVPVQ